MTIKKPDYHLPVIIESQKGENSKKGIVFRNVPCQIFLPEDSHGQVMAHLELDEGQAEVIGIFGNLFWEMSIKGWLRWGGTFTQINAQKCYIRNGNWPSLRNGCSFQKINLPLEVLDLQIVEARNIGQEGIQDTPLGKNSKAKKPRSLPALEYPEKPALASFWLTYNRDLLTGGTEISHHNGSIEVETFEPHKFELLPELEFTFASEFRWNSDTKTRQHNRRETLAANVSLKSKGTKPVVMSAPIIEALDEFLLLASFATRWKTICLGWDLSQWPYLSKKYRHGLTLPLHLKGARHTPEQDYETGLVSPNSLPEFLRHAWPLWRSLDKPSREMLHHVLQAVVHAQSLDLHESFISHYATLEMMVLHFRRQNDLEFVFSDENEWNTFKAEVKEFITKKSSLSGSQPQQKIKRGKVSGKLEEFNRVAFSTAFKAFCEERNQPIPCQDLWPVTGNKSLSYIRNNLVHGVLDGRDQVNAIWVAKNHMEWLVERSILCLLSWPIEKSRVTPRYLHHLTPYGEERWKAERELLFA